MIVKSVKRAVSLLFFIMLYCVCWYSIILYFSVLSFNPEDVAVMFLYFVILPGFVVVVVTVNVVIAIVPHIIRIARWLKPPEKPKPWVYEKPKKRKKRKRAYVEEKSDYEPPKKHIKGELFKRLGITYDKPERKPEKKNKLPEITKRKDYKKDRLMKKWESLIHELNDKGNVKISRHSHHGQLRGVDILLHAKKDLRRLGYDVKIIKRGNEGEIRIR